MKNIKLLISCLIVTLISCRTSRQNIDYIVKDQEVAVTVSAQPQPFTESKESVMRPYYEAVSTEEKKEILPANTINEEKTINSSTNKSNLKVHSFAEWKEMAHNGSLKMTKKEVRMLNKLEKKYHGDFNMMKEDLAEMSTTAKVIAGVAIVGGVFALFFGSWFGAVLFVIGLILFIFKWIGLFEF